MDIDDITCAWNCSTLPPVVCIEEGCYPEGKA